MEKKNSRKVGRPKGTLGTKPNLVAGKILQKAIDVFIAQCYDAEQRAENPHSLKRWRAGDKKWLRRIVPELLEIAGNSGIKKEDLVELVRRAHRRYTLDDETRRGFIYPPNIILEDHRTKKS